MCFLFTLFKIDTQLASPSPRDDSQTATLNDETSKIVTGSESTATTTPTNEVEEVIPSFISESSGNGNSDGEAAAAAASQQTSDSSSGDHETGASGDTPTSVPSTSTSTSTSTATTTTTSTTTVTQSSTTTVATPSPAMASQQIPTVVAPVIIGNGKDAVLMRLSNRVKILELNMTLSSQYLEKLSQHYR